MSYEKHQKKYSKSAKGRATTARWKKSAKGKEAKRDYDRSPKGKYGYHLHRAKVRGVPWEFTFETWWAMWEPYFDRMGQQSHQLQMCRTGDIGPYSPDNCRIDTCANNTRESHRTRRLAGE